jgi:hypothetical protein
MEKSKELEKQLTELYEALPTKEDKEKFLGNMWDMYFLGFNNGLMISKIEAKTPDWYFSKAQEKFEEYIKKFKK